MNEDELKGTASELAGKAETALGGALGDEALAAEGQVHQAQGRARKLYGAAKGAVESAAESAAGAAGAALGAARETFAGRSAAEADEEVVAAGDEVPAGAGGLGRAEEMVREQPLLALLGAAAAGYVLAFLLHGARR